MNHFCLSEKCLRAACKSVNSTRGVLKENTISVKGSAVKYCPDCNSILRQGFNYKTQGKQVHKRDREMFALARRV